MNNPETKAPGHATVLRHLQAPLRHLRSNVVSYIALAVALGASGSYALAASGGNGTIGVCVDKGTGVMHLAKHPRCGRHQSRIGLSSALDRPSVSAWAAVNGAGLIESAAGVKIAHTGAGLYHVSVTAGSCRHAFNNAPVVSIDDSQPPAGFADRPGAFPVTWTETASSGVEAFTIHTGVVVNGQFQPQDEAFNITDSCR